ncbi:MAG TPA: C25 family cysteine peptidase [Candidatus Binatia bacterium]|nr:C25 family cysteine peptidase [Candidatus Binatia bacterium]
MRSIPGPRGSKPIRVLSAGLALGIVFATASLCPPRAVAASNGGSGQAVRTVAQDARGATFDVVPNAARFDSVNVGGAQYERVTLPGAVVLETPGKPALPTLSLYVAVPDGMSPRLRVTSEAWSDRRGLSPLPVARQKFLSDTPDKGPVSELTTDPDPAVYQSAGVYPVEPAALGVGALVGSWWVAPINVHPVRWDPKAGAYRMLGRMTLRVDFVPASDRELAARPATRPGAQARAWDRVQHGLVQNYEAARAFPRRPPRAGSLGVAPPGGSRAAGAKLAGNPEWKLSVTSSGWVSVSYASLAAGGFPSGIAIANLRVEERGYDDAADAPTATPIPVVGRDNNGNGTFDAGDAITFYARSLRDRVGAGNIELRYSDVNVYWLTWDNTQGPRPAPIAGDMAGAAATPTSFRNVIRLEEDHFAKMAAYYDPFAAKPEAIEYLFWTDGEDGDQFSQGIPFVDPDPSQPFRIRARYQGKGVTGVTHHLDVFFRGTVTDTLAAGFEFVDQDVWVLDTGFTIPGTHIGGTNSYQHIGQRRGTPGGPLLDGSFAFLDVIEATYNRLYRARSNYLAFNSGGSTGLTEIRVGGFTASNVEVYDVTDPAAPDSVTGVVVSQTSPGVWEALFRTDASSGERRFVALVPGSETALTGSAVVADAASNLRQPGAFGASDAARSIFILPQAFRAQADQLADFRRAQGYVVEEADIADVYDEFNGGIKSARAIRRYLRHAWLAWTPQPLHVVLMGDGSLDYRGHLADASFDWVPTYLKFSTIPDNYGRELVAQDTYYAFNLAAIEPGPSDFVPSVALTRIPASDGGELQSVVDKTIAYETFQPTDSWRGRQILYSDDEYSTGINAAQPYCFSPQEVLFKQGSQDMADITVSSPGGVDIANVAVDLKPFTDVVPASGGCKSFAAVLAVVNSLGNVSDVLIDEMNQGALIFNMETHANRYLISHETVLTNGTSQFAPASRGTPDRIQNVGRPWYAMVWGCHTNQFADGPFMTRALPTAVDTLDALGEQWLTMPSRGSIGSLGSTALEFLQTNTVYNDFVARAFYETPPAPPPPPGEPPQARWILGEVMLQAQVRNGLTGNSEANAQTVMNRTIHLFADPMLRMDALPPRVADVTIGGTPFADNAALTTDSPTDSLALVANLRDEVGIDSVYVTEQDIVTNVVKPLDPASYAVTFGDSSRVATLTGSVRPRVGNYDLQIRAIDVNGRSRTFTMQVRTPVRYLANGVDIVNGVFVQSGSTLRGEVIAPIPLTSDSVSLRIDGIPVAATITKLDGPGRQWALEFVASDLFSGTHTIQLFVGTQGFEHRTFQTTSEFTLRGVAVVDPRMQGTGCGGSIFQYELSAAARKVELQLFTVAGRRVASIDLPGQAGFNVFCWDGRDSRAHETAQGVYLYRLRATDSSGKTVTRDGRMIRAR